MPPAAGLAVRVRVDGVPHRDGVVNLLEDGLRAAGGVGGRARRRGDDGEVVEPARRHLVRLPLAGGGRLGRLLRRVARRRGRDEGPRRAAVVLAGLLLVLVGPLLGREVRPVLLQPGLDLVERASPGGRDVAGGGRVPRGCRAVLVLERGVAARHAGVGLLRGLADDLELQRAVLVLGQTLDAHGNAVVQARGGHVYRGPRVVDVVPLAVGVHVVPQLLCDPREGVVPDDRLLHVLREGDALDELVVERAVLLAVDGGEPVRDALRPLRQLPHLRGVPHVVGLDRLGARGRRGEPVHVVSVGLHEVLHERVRGVGPDRAGRGGLRVALPHREGRAVRDAEVDPVRDHALVGRELEKVVERRFHEGPREALDETAEPSRYLLPRAVALDAHALGEDLEAPLAPGRVDPRAGLLPGHYVVFSCWHPCLAPADYSTT